MATQVPEQEMRLNELATWIGTLSGVVSIIVSLILAKRANKRKGLSYAVLFNASSTAHTAAAEGDIGITLGEKEVSNPYSIVVELRNSGNEPITRGDFERPITISFGHAAIVQYTVKSNPSDLRPVLSERAMQLGIDPLLLNPGDSLLISTILDGVSDQVEVQGRITGVKSIQHLPREQPRFIGILPPISRRTSPITAALVSFLFGGLGAGIYFRSIIDGLLVLGITLVVFFFPAFDWTWLVSLLVAGLYSYLRSQHSNKYQRD